MEADELMARVSTLVSPPLSPRSDTAAINTPVQTLQDDFITADNSVDFAGVDGWRPTRIAIETVAFPAGGICKADSGCTSYAIRVQIRGGLQWVIRKRYSEVRGLHDRLKASGAPVKHLHFPAKHFARNLKANALEQRRRKLEEYIATLLEIRPLLRRELFNFLAVYENVKAQERVQRATAIGLVRLATVNDSTLFDGATTRVDEEHRRRRSLSENELLLPLSPATLTVDSSNGDPQSGFDSPLMRPRASSLFNIEDCVEMCLHMDELQELSEDVLERLLRTRNCLVEADHPTALHAMQLTYDQIGRRFHAFLDQHADRSTIERLVSTRTLISILHEYNFELDALQSDLGLEEMAWKTVWNGMVQSVEESLVKMWEENNGGLRTELPDAESQNGALTLLKNETRRSELQRSSSSQELLEAAIETVAQISDATMGDIPNRFIPEHEVQRNSQPFSSGSSGTVYRGNWMGVKVVIKYVNVSSPDDMRAFLQETKIWDMARHPNVVAYYGACHLPRPCFFVSEEAVNGSAADFLAKEKMQGRTWVWRAMHGAALGLRFLHEHNIVHGDLKCNNIVVDANGVAKLTDFGMSFLNGASCAACTGPARWTAPECLVRKQKPSFQSDKYSLGMCIIEAATASVPWGVRVEDAIVFDELAHGRFLPRPAGLNDAQWRLVTSLCAFEPNKRCSLSDAISQLEQFATAEADAERLR